MAGPSSSYSALVVTWSTWGDPHGLEGAEGREMEPPIQTEHLRCGGAMALNFMVGGARATSSLVACVAGDSRAWPVTPARGR